MKRKKNKSILIILFLLIIIFIVFVISKNKNVPIPTTENAVRIINNEEKKITTLYFVGDIMLTRGVKTSVDKNFNGDYNKLFENLGILKEADILFGNLEGDVSDVGTNVGSKYSFRMDPKVLPALKEAGFDAFLFANNHVGDWSIRAFKDTLARLNNIGILKTGAGEDKYDAKNPTIIEKNGVKFGFLGFSDVGPNWIEANEKTAGILLASDPDFKEIVQSAKTKCDVLIVSFHFGEEYKLIHNKRQEELAHSAIDNGADMVIGGHSHVMEDIEKYKEKTIVYSLGNFIFDQYFSKDTMRGMLFEATYDGINLIKTEKKIITLNKKFQPEGIFSEEEIKARDLSASSNCPRPQKEYTDMSLLNIGQDTSLPDTTYIPKNLLELNTDSSTKKDLCLVKNVKEAFELMAEGAQKENVKIKASSTFRTYATQKTLYENDLKSKKIEISDSVAKPGYSEHQLGTTMDITGASIDYASASDKFDGTIEDKWLKKNSYLYGFIQSYPYGKENTTGYKYEPWHYRYVGIKNAQKIKDLDLTITEFLK